MPGMRAVFRADASGEVGVGHVVRCLALAEALRAAGVSCAFAVSKGTSAAAPLLASSTFTLVELPDDATDKPAALAERWPQGVELLIVDHYDLDKGYARACRQWAQRILVIDDLADRPQDCDILVDPTSGRAKSAYRGRVPGGCRLLLGSGYALLRGQFAAMRETARAHRGEMGKVRRVQVSMGGTDPNDATSVALAGIAESGLDVEVDVVLGRAAPNLSAVRQLASTLPQHVTVHVDVANMAKLMTEADVAIGAAGSSSWERCCLGLPSIVVPVARNQAANAAALAGAEAAVVLPGEGRAREKSIARALKRLAADDDARAAMSRAATRLCDGLGARRVALESVPLVVSRPGRPVSLRPATAADSSLVFDWQRHPATRRFARNPVAPTRQEHERWMSKRLNSGEGLFDIILHEGRPAGVLRLDRRRDGSFEVSIFVDPEAHGQGLGSAALRAARWLMPEATLRAEVLSENAASHALFRACGYRWTGDYYLSLPIAGGPTS